MVILGGLEFDQKEDIRNVNTKYISGSIPSSQGNFGIVVVPYAPTLEVTSVTGGTTVFTQAAMTGSVAYTAHYKNKTIYVSSNIATNTLYPTGATIYIEGCNENWSTGAWYIISSVNYLGKSSKAKYYFNTEEYHPYMRTRVVSGSGGPSGAFMTVITAGN